MGSLVSQYTLSNLYTSQYTVIYTSQYTLSNLYTSQYTLSNLY